MQLSEPMHMHGSGAIVQYTVVFMTTTASRFDHAFGAVREGMLTEAVPGTLTLRTTRSSIS